MDTVYEIRLKSFASLKEKLKSFNISMISMIQALEYFADITDQVIALRIIKYLLPKEDFVLYRDIKSDLNLTGRVALLILYDLKRKGAVKSEWETLSETRKMRKFTLTEECRNVFQEEMAMVKPLTYEESVKMQEHLYPLGLTKPESLFVLSHLTEKALTTEEIMGILPEDLLSEDRSLKGYVLRMMEALEFDGFVDREIIPGKTSKWSKTDYGRDAEEVVHRLAKVTKEGRAYRKKIVEKAQSKAKK